MKKKKFLVNRIFLEQEFLSLKPFVEIVNNFSAITQRANIILAQKQEPFISNSIVYRAYMRGHLPDEIVCWAIINATKQYVIEISSTIDKKM